MTAIPPGVAGVLRPVLPDIAAEIIRAIAREVPDYSRPMEGPFGVAVRDGVERALRRFVATIERPEAIGSGDRRVYIELGRGERRQGRTLNALLAAYRVGAQVAWRRFVEAGVQAGVEPETLYRVGEAIFAYIDEISGESIEGYAAEQSAAAGEQQRLRAQLVRLLAAATPAAPDVLRAAAERAGWTPTAIVAALLVEAADPERLAGRLGPGAVAAGLDPGDGAAAAEGELAVATRPGSGVGHVLAFLADASAPGTRERVEQATSGRAAALGPAVALEESGRSAARAHRALELLRAGALRVPERPAGAGGGQVAAGGGSRSRFRGGGSRTPSADGLVVADDHASALVLHADSALAAELAAARLRPLAEMRPAAHERLRQTLHVWLDLQGRIDDTARALSVHPQTVRYRLGQLREAFGPVLDDPEARFELALALRVTPPGAGPTPEP